MANLQFFNLKICFVSLARAGDVTSSQNETRFGVSLARAGDVRRCSILNTWLTPLGLARRGSVLRIALYLHAPPSPGGVLPF